MKHSATTSIHPGAVVELVNSNCIIRSVKEKAGRVTLDTVPIHEHVDVIKHSIPVCWWDEFELVFPVGQSPAVNDIIRTKHVSYLVTGLWHNGGTVHCQMDELH